MNAEIIIDKLTSTNTIPLNDKFQDILLGYLNRETVNTETLNRKTKIILFLRKHKDEVNIDKLSEVLQIKTETARAILTGKIITTSFPVTGKNNNLITTYIIMLPNHSETLFFKKSLENPLATLKLLFNMPFAALFEDNNFTGNSFMLAVAAALLVDKQEKITQFAFTGAVSPAGDIQMVDGIKEKTEIAIKHSKKLISPEIFTHINQLNLFLNSPKIHIPFSISTKNSKSSRTPKEAALQNLKTISSLIESKHKITVDSVKKLYELKDEDLIFHTEDNFLPETDWEPFIKKAYQKILDLRSKIKDKICVFHFSLLAPSTFSFGLGTMFGCKEPFVVYQYSAGNYIPVLDYSETNIRKLKEIKKKPHNLIKCKSLLPEDNNASILAIVIYIASQNPMGDVKRFLNRNYEKAQGILLCKSSSQGNLPLSDWTEYINDLYYSYNKIRELDISAKKFLFLSIPTAMAFGLGVVIETFDNIEVFNYSAEESGYFKVFSLPSLKS